MSYLHERWNPRNGSIYANLSSDLSIEWSKADNSERERIRSELARFNPNLFTHCMNSPASPNWVSLNIEADIGANEVHRLLFAMAADEAFLVEDRFEVDVTRFNRHLLRSKLNWSDSYDKSEIPSRIQG